MAEEFINRLSHIEEKIDALGGTLKRMITILAAIPDLKSEIKLSKEEIIQTVSAQSPFAPSSEKADETFNLVRAELASLEERMQQKISESIAGLREELKGMLNEIIEKIPEATEAPPFAPVSESPPPAISATTVTTTQMPEPMVAESSVPEMTSRASSLPPDKAMKVADYLDGILKSLKMGCKASDVLEIMTEAKMEITRIVESDPILIKLDKWIGLVGAYPKRNELKAKDVIALKKELRAEIPKYRPA